MAIRLEDVFPGCTSEEYEKLRKMDLPLFEVIGHREITPEENQMVEDFIKTQKENENHTG